MTFQRIAVIGAGAWGTALANCAVRAGRDVTLWARDAASAAQIANTRESPRLPGIRLDARIAATGAIADVAHADALLLAVPAQDLRTAKRFPARCRRSCRARASRRTSRADCRPP